MRGTIVRSRHPMRDAIGGALHLMHDAIGGALRPIRFTGLPWAPYD
jgi:hypothetical protein